MIFAGVSGTVRETRDDDEDADRQHVHQKIHGHVNDVVSQPPSSGPTAAIPEMTAPHTPNAMPGRVRGTWR